MFLKLLKNFRSKCKSYVSDVTNYVQIKNIINKQRKIDILVNNAGANIPEHFTKVKKKNMEYLVKLNTISTFHLAIILARVAIRKIDNTNPKTNNM